MSAPSRTKPPKERANRALVHDEFDHIEVISETGEKIKKSQCKHCAPDSKNRVLTGRNPSNLRDHLKSFHREVYLRSKGNFYLDFIIE